MQKRGRAVGNTESKARQGRHRKSNGLATFLPLHVVIAFQSGKAPSISDLGPQLENLVIWILQPEGLRESSRWSKTTGTNYEELAMRPERGARKAQPWVLPFSACTTTLCSRQKTGTHSFITNGGPDYILIWVELYAE